MERLRRIKNKKNILPVWPTGFFFSLASLSFTYSSRVAQLFGSTLRPDDRTFGLDFLPEKETTIESAMKVLSLNLLKEVQKTFKIKFKLRTKILADAL